MLALLLTMLAQAAVAPPSAEGGEVVVTGRRYTDELERCMKQACPPEREVDAALNAAVEDFRQGRYAQARALLQRTIARNKKYGARIPGPISDLYATYADLSLHDGYVRDHRSATYASFDVLRDHLGETHAATLAVRPTIGDMLVADGRPTAADEVYRSAARNARIAGQAELATWIDLRRAWLAVQLGNETRALAMLDGLSAQTMRGPAYDSVARAIRVRAAIRRKDDTLVERLIGEWRTSAAKPPVLLYQPVQPTFASAPSMLRQGSMVTGGSLAWVDIGFWVKPTGAVAQVEALRPDGADSWAKPLMKQIAGRRYAPLDIAGASPGVYRIERITLRSAFDIVTGSRIAARAGTPEIIRADLTDTLERTGPAIP